MPNSRPLGTRSISIAFQLREKLDREARSRQKEKKNGYPLLDFVWQGGEREGEGRGGRAGRSAEGERGRGEVNYLFWHIVRRAFDDTNWDLCCQPFEMIRIKRGAEQRRGEERRGEERRGEVRGGEE